MKPEKKATPPTKKSKPPVKSRRVVMPDDATATAIAKHFHALVQALGDLGHHDAVNVLYRLEHEVLGEATDRAIAVSECARALHLDISAVTDDTGAIDRMAIAADLPRKPGQQPDPWLETAIRLINYVEEGRRKKKVWKTDEPQGHDDTTIVVSLVWQWVGSHGVPDEVTDPDPAKFAKVKIADPALMAKLVKLTSRNARKLVLKVHQELGYAGTETIRGALQKRDSREREQAESRPNIE